jgi:hypothetical protein
MSIDHSTHESSEQFKPKINDEFDWRRQCDFLIARFADHGICSDLSAMTDSEVWGLYRYLRRLAQRQA